jgi:hypothetical protein
MMSSLEIRLRRRKICCAGCATEFWPAQPLRWLRNRNLAGAPPI